MNDQNHEKNDQKFNLILGHSRFTKQFFETILPQLSPNTLRILNSMSWSIQIDQKWTKVLKELQQTECRLFATNQGLGPQFKLNLIHGISHVSFTNIYQLRLRANNIYSIEAIAFLQMNNLEKVRLQSNFITSLKPFNKTKWPKLKEFCIRNNKLQVTDISRAQIKELDYLTFSYYNSDNIQMQMEDPKTLVKNQNPLLRYLFLHQNQQVIFNQKIFKALKDKFQNAEIQWSKEKVQEQYIE